MIKNPVTDYLPLGIKIIGTSTKADLINFNEYVQKEQNAHEEKSGKSGIAAYKSVCYVIGAVSTGNPGMENNIVTESIKISSQSLSAACVCQKLCCSYERLWGVI